MSNEKWMIDQIGRLESANKELRYEVNSLKVELELAKQPKEQAISKPKDYEVLLQYFKNSGKYYTEGKYLTTKLQMFEIVDEVKAMRAEGKLPGIRGTTWTVYVSSEEHPNGYPCLVLNTDELRLDAEEAKLVYSLLKDAEATIWETLNDPEQDLLKKVTKFTDGKW